MASLSVPCGKYATQMLGQDGVTIPTGKITLGQDVKATLAAVASGDADAAIVYATDAKAAGTTVTEVPIAASLNVLAVYPIAPIAASPPSAGSFASSGPAITSTATSICTTGAR